jgi:beta-galactosidase
MFKTSQHIITHILILITTSLFAQVRKDISLDQNWRTIAHDQDVNAYFGFEMASFKDKDWKSVNVPHNWDQYEGYRRLMHGNRHGYSWYRKTFNTNEKRGSKRFFLWFEGVGSYATVFLNGKKVGYHAGGRTSFTLDVTDVILLNNKPNVLAVRADHPPHIQDLPWVCGGCSTERGFSEGSQPMGIFRPVHLIVTNEVRIEPFGVHVWNDASVSEKFATLNLSAEIKNYGLAAKNITLNHSIVDAKGKVLAENKSDFSLKSGALEIPKTTITLSNPTLWSIENPYLYTVQTKVYEKGKLIDELATPYGVRWISWPIGRNNNDKRFFLNGKPVFINGIAEYEHLLGQSHAFSAEQVSSRVRQMKAAGFNAFRDAHQPHNLRYHDFWDKQGILWWTQMAAHVWYDTPEFRKNFKTLLADWVKERRNSPSIVLWGLENESTLPEEFARECTELIRQLDPTTSSQRLVTTCNGGSGTDWDVPQNWTGTYGGDPKTYDQDMERQVLIGEYGAWRTLDLHTEGPFNQAGPYSEDRMTQLMEMKVRLAESAKDRTSGHFFWLFTSHDNPGRVQGGEGLRELDRIGPVNYKGLLTPWEEPLDVFYMFRANYAPKETDPMLYIVSHTWPQRWLSPGIKDSISVYSNCDEVELFNDVDGSSLGRKKRSGGIGTHFQWDKAAINYNVLYAKGYVNGKQVATDYIVLHNLPQAPGFARFYNDARPVTAPAKGLNYLYRVNCGGPDYIDENGNTWLADRQKIDSKSWGSNSWTKDFPGTPAFFASQRRTHDPIKGSRDWKLLQDFRYGRDKLTYEFPVANGEYTIDLFFIEPWQGTGGMDCTGMRIFDVAVNGKTVIDDLDIWKEVGHDAVLKKTVKVKVSGGQLILSFPEVKSGQALISAIAIASENLQAKSAPGAASIIQGLSSANVSAESWLDVGDKVTMDSDVTFVSLPSNLYAAEWIRTRSAKNENYQFSLLTEGDVFVAYPAKAAKPRWLGEYELTGNELTTSANSGEKYSVYRKRIAAGQKVAIKVDTSVQPIVAVLPSTVLEPAHDLKKAIAYKAVDSKFIGEGLKKEVLMGRERATFKRASGDVLEFTISTGVADVYSLTVKYHNPFQKILKAKIEVLAADGTLMKAPESFDLVPTKEGKWNYFSTNTGTMINAGTYKVRIIAESTEGVSIDAIEVQ